MAGGCYSEVDDVTEEFWEAILTDLRAPYCPSGYWLPNPFFGTFAFKPLVTVEFTTR